MRSHASAKSIEIYKNTILSANSGLVSSSESDLAPAEKMLLEVRRLLSQAKFESVDRLFLQLEQKKLSSLLKGDFVFLQGIKAHRLGQLDIAQKSFYESSLKFREIGEMHRSLRAKINSEICSRDHQSYLCGSLFLLEKEARRESFFDLVGNILKARAIELCVQGFFAEAQVAAKDAVRAYAREACAEDESVAMALLATLDWVQGDKVSANDNRLRVRVLSPKVKIFLEVFESLVSGRNPSLPDSHPLAKTEWPIAQQKESSVSGKILQQLKKQPTSRDQLIQLVWPEDTWTPSHTGRLYSAITHMRKSLKVAIAFDGEKYYLAS